LGSLYSAPPDPLAEIQGAYTSKRRGQEKEWKGRVGEEEGKGKERAGR